MTYYALAYYIFTEIEEPLREVKNHKRFFKERDVSARIYISEQGINGQMSGSQADCEAYMQWMHQDSRFKDIHFKIHKIQENIFPRVTVKYRKDLVAMGESVDLSQRGEYVSPEEWKEMLESGEYLLIDVRNDYETKIGHFEGAELPPLENFRDFPKYADELAEKVDPKKTKVMMCCTGGIRCEVYSAALKKRGFEDVYQLQGGIINYGEKVGRDHWKGSLFVFDDRLATPIDGKPVEPISSCSFCGTASDLYHNCANMDCNELFLCCAECAVEKKSCCSAKCEEAPRRRPFDPKKGNKPFRKKHLLECGCSA
jgi:UPF0176 protein